MFDNATVLDAAAALAEFADACADIGGGGAPGGLVPAYPPGQLEALLRYSRVLAAHAARESAGVPFAQIRVDFFVLGPAVYFAELTLYTQACFTKWTPPALDMLLGHIASTPTTAVSPGCLAKAVAAECPASQGGGKMHGDLSKSAKDETLEASLFAAFNTDWCARSPILLLARSCRSRVERKKPLKKPLLLVPG